MDGAESSYNPSFVDAGRFSQTSRKSRSNAGGAKSNVDENGCGVAAGSSRLSSLIDSITTSPEKELNLGLIQSIKQLVRSCDANVHVAFNLLMEKLKKNHAQVRYLSLLVMDELFTRSKLFRSLLVSNFETFMLLTVGYRSDYPLPLPADRATLLKVKSMEILEKWNDVFGMHYKQLRLGYEYLKDTLRLQFPNLRQAAAQREQQRKDREARSQVLIQKKYETLKEQYISLRLDIQSTLSQSEQCFCILANADKEHATPVDVTGQFLERNGIDVDVDDSEEYGVKCLRHTRENGTEEPTPHETGDNGPVFDTLRDLFKLIVNQHIPTTQEWLSILMKVDPEDKQFHNSILKSTIDLRNQLFSARSKCNELGINIIDREAQETINNIEDIIWEVGEASDWVACVEGNVTSKYMDQQTSHAQEDRVMEAQQVSTFTNTTYEVPDKRESSVKQQLLEQAPILPWGSFLDRWGTEDVVPANQRGLVLENHWGKVDYDALIPADKFAAMNVRASYYKSQEFEIQPCLAPLKDGKLCQRRDLRVCPFHGPILPRDLNGEPIVENQKEKEDSKQSSTKETQKCELMGNSGRPTSPSHAALKEEVLMAITAEAVANVRNKDEGERKQRWGQHLQRKRDREHNDAILRAAALAHTSQGLGEVLGEDLDVQGTGVSRLSKKQKGCLRAMLQKKVTAKDRLARRLLSGQAIDATIRQFTRDEEAAYREAFPNQW